jgi:hypothetical protein
MNNPPISPLTRARPTDAQAALTADRDRKLTGFFLFQILIPTIFIVGAWPLAKLLWDPAYVFEKTFVSPDLLLLGALLCITIAVEVYFDIRRLQSSAKSIKLDNIVLFSLAIAVLLLLIFGLTKAKSFTVDFPNPPGPSPKPDVTGCVWCSILGGTFGLLWASWAAFRASTSILELERQEISEIP